MSLIRLIHVNSPNRPRSQSQPFPVSSPSSSSSSSPANKAMAQTWIDSEVDMWSFFMLREQYPMYATGLIHMVIGLLKNGFPSVDIFVPFVTFPMTYFFYTKVATLTHLKSRFAMIFAYYQLMQLLHLYIAFETPSLSFLYQISSTILLVHCEITPLVGTAASVGLILKHFAMWQYYVWRTEGLFEISIDSGLSVAWSVFHLWNYLITKRASLISSFDNLQETRLEKERMFALLQAIPDGVLVLTEHKHIVKYNQTLTKMLHASPTHPEKSILSVLTTLEYAPNYKKYQSKNSSLMSDIEEVMQNGKEIASVDFGSVLLSGRYLEWRGNFTQWSRQSACVLTVRDVGEWVQLESLSKKESAAKSALIRSVSHELRTPINAIINLSERLMDTEELTMDGKDQCRILISSSQFLLSTVNDLLDFSRIANEKFSLMKQPFQLEEAIRSCVTLLEPQCKLKEVDLTLRYDCLIPNFAYNDQNRVKQVMLNLLSNALKFTLRGKIEVVAVLISRSHVRISVQDTGIGIAPDAQSKIFTLFGKLDGNEKLNPQGCGLGLAISNILVKNMGGSGITVESKPGQGSTFFFSLPINEGDSDREEGSTFESDASDVEENSLCAGLPCSKELWRDPSADPNILIADDSEFNRLVLVKMMESLGYSCDQAYTGADALHKIEDRYTKRAPYALIFLDVEMPEMSGIEVVMELRKKEAEGEMVSSPVVIGCSAYVSFEDRQNCLTAGMNFFLEKPVAKTTLVALVSRIQM